MTKRSPTTKDIGLLQQLFKQGQLTLAAEFQRNSVWPRAAKAYLIDTILNDRPIPLLFFQRTTSAQTGNQAYTVIDGQQRLRAIFEFLDDRFSLTESSVKSAYFKKRFSDLSDNFQSQIMNYDLVIEELSGYSESDIEDMFVRFNKYLVKLSPQEMRHAKGSGRFHDFVERIGKDNFWRDHHIFSGQALKRMKSVEFSAELVILLIEGPQDKKASVDLYYGQYKNKFPESTEIETRLRNYLKWIITALPNLSTLRYRSPVDLYSLIGALDHYSSQGKQLSQIKADPAGQRLLDFQNQTKLKSPIGDAARYVAAASRQTDNIIPRNTRIEILERILKA